MIADMPVAIGGGMMARARGFLSKKTDSRETEMKAVIAAGMQRSEMSRRTLANKVGIPYPTLGKFIREPEYMKYTVLIKILDVLNVPMDDRQKLL